jgi:dolichol-phosphate mannosyltransferase
MATTDLRERRATSGRTLIFVACYNERENIGRLLDGIVGAVPGADVLVVEDSSPDGTWDLLMDKRREYPQLACVQRPRKLGIGSAHKYALFYAMRKRYQTLVTMDADFSHDPAAIPSLLASHDRNAFVTGSRYCEGGSSDYEGYRDFVSRLGNFLARHTLGVRLRELTTYFRVFDVATIARLPLRRIAAGGYSYGVQLIYYLRKAGVELREMPIHFVDRTHGKSKIPRMQILWSALDLTRLGLERMNPFRDLQPDYLVGDACSNCGDRVLAMKRFGRRPLAAVGTEACAGAYRPARAGRSRPPVYTCLRCGLEQVPASLRLEVTGSA